MKNKRILVTGGAGFIGSHLVEELVARGATVSVADNLLRGNLRNLSDVRDKISFLKVDLREMKNCLKATRGVEYVFHLAAAVGGIHYIKKARVENLTSSTLMNINMLEASVKNRVERFLFTSSACIYRERAGQLNQFREEDGLPAWPATTYGWAKILGEIGGQAYHQDFRLKTCSVRIFNCYGERENLDPRWSHVIPSMARKAIRYPKEGFRIFGDGKQERAFLYVKDCVRGLILAMEKIEDGSVINLGSEELVSIGELAKKVAALSGKEIKIEYDLSGPQGTQRYCADTSHLRKTLGWVPDTPLEKGLRNIYQWAEKELNRDKR